MGLDISNFSKPSEDPSQITGGTGSGGSGVSSVTAADGSVVVGGTGGAPTVATGALDQIATLHPPAAAVALNAKKITGLANGTAAQDAAAFGQIPTALPPSITTVTATVSVATYTIDLSLGQRFVLTLNAANVALSVGGSTTNQQAANGFELILIQDATGGRTVTWIANTKWAGAVAPTLTSTALREDDFAFESWDNQATWRGFVEGQDMR